MYANVAITTFIPVNTDLFVQKRPESRMNRKVHVRFGGGCPGTLPSKYGKALGFHPTFIARLSGIFTTRARLTKRT